MPPFRVTKTRIEKTHFYINAESETAAVLKVAADRHWTLPGLITISEESSSAEVNQISPQEFEAQLAHRKLMNSPLESLQAQANTYAQ